MKGKSHTPLPWETDVRRNTLTGAITDNKGNLIAVTPSRFALKDKSNHISEETDNFEFIVKACNSHYELIEMLIRAERFINVQARGMKYGYAMDLAKDISLVLSKAEALK